MKPGASEQIFQGGTRRITELEALLDRNDSKSVRQYVIDHPEIIRPDFVRAYASLSFNDQVVDLSLLLPGEESPEFIIVKVGHLNDDLFAEANSPSKAYSQAQAELSSIEAYLTTGTGHTTLAGSDFSKATFLYITGRSAKLTYAQRKFLFEQNSKSKRKVESYDDLINRFRFYINDLTEIRDRFVPTEALLKRLNISTDNDFDSILQEIDREMQAENIRLPARSFEGWRRFSSVFRLSLTNSDPLSQKIFDWFKTSYGDRANIMMGLGSIGIMLRGDLLRMELPVGYGLNRIACSRELTKDRQSTVIGSREKPPTINPLDFVTGLTQELANTLTDDEVEGIFNQFVFGFRTLMRLRDGFDRSELTKQSQADLLAAANHLLDSPPNYSLSKWASLQAAEKFIKHFIVEKGGTAPKSHDLKKLASLAESYGVHQIPETWLDDIQCSADIRYGSVRVTAQEAIEAQYASLQVCDHVVGDLSMTK